MATERGRPLLSVTVLNYNYGRFLPECLDSILGQTFRDFEVIVIDDCSTDESIRAIQPYLSDPRVRLVRHVRNQGVVASLIEGTEVHSRGRFLTVVSADDVILRPDAFARQMILLNNENVAFCFSGYSRFESESRRIFATELPFPRDMILAGEAAFRSLLQDIHVQVLHTGTIVRASSYYAAGGYRRDIQLAVDFIMWPLLSLEGDVGYCADALYGWRAHDDQMTQSFHRVWQLTRDIARSVDIACTRASDRAIETSSLHVQAMRCSLSMMPLDDAFRNRRRLALMRVAAAILVSPRFSLTNRGLWAATARATLGASLFGRIRGLVRGVSRYGPSREPPTQLLSSPER